MKKMLKHMITQKGKKILMITSPPRCLVVPKSKRHSTRTFHLSGWETNGFRWTTAKGNWNCSSFLCLHICKCAWYQKDHRGVFFTSTGVGYLGSVLCMVGMLSELYFILQKARDPKVTAIAEEKNRQGICKEYFGKRAELFHHGYAVLDWFVDAWEIPTDTINFLERPASF